jgi:hypothetical protein
MTGNEPDLAAERDRLARLLREARLQLSMTQARLAALEQSATLELGRTLVRAARRPWSRGAALPRDLFRMWRSGGTQDAPVTSPAMLALASAQLSDLAGGGERMLSALTAPGLAALIATGQTTADLAALTATGPTAPALGNAALSNPALGNPALGNPALGNPALGNAALGNAALGNAAPAVPGLVVTGVLTARACATLAPDAVVQPLLPHDADVLLESSGADLVLIEAAAVLAGSAWAYAVDPAGADRGRRLGRLIATARTLGKPVIFIRNVPAYLAPGLAWVAASCDAVSEAGFGVQLAQFNPVGIDPAGDRPWEPAYADARDPREPASLRALLDAIAGDGGPVRVLGQIPWRRWPAVYRAHRLFVTADDDQARAQRACGARVIIATGEPADVLRQITDAVAQDPPGWAEILAGLRETFLAHATPVRLAELTRLAGLAAPDALVTARQVAVLARVGSAETATGLAAAVLRQRLRPAELVVHTDGPARQSVAAALASTALASPALASTALASTTLASTTLADAGIKVRVIASAGPAPDGAWLRACAAAARSPWAAPWDSGRDYPDTYLLDLACARECAQADAVGPADTVGPAPFAFVSSIEPGLARRDLLGFGRLDVRHGLRLCSVSAAADQPPGRTAQPVRSDTR